MSGQRERERRRVERRAGEAQKDGADPETYSDFRSRLPDSLMHKLKVEAAKRGISVAELGRIKLGDDNPTLHRGPRTDTDYESSVTQIQFKDVRAEDVEHLPIDLNNELARRQVFFCLGGRYKHGTQVYPHDPRGSGYLLLWNETGQDLGLYHFPILDKSGQQHWAKVERFTSITKDLLNKTDAERRAHPDYREWRTLNSELNFLDNGSIADLLQKLIWHEFCYSQIRRQGRLTPQAMLTRGLYDEVLKGNTMWRAPGSTYHVEADQDVLPIETLRKQMAEAR